MAWVRASSLDRTLQCLASTYLFNTNPKVRLVGVSERAADAGEYGTMVHHWKETGEVVGKESHVKTFTKKLDELKAAGIERLAIWPNSGYHEVAVAYNCVTGIVDIAHEGGSNEFKSSHSEPWVTGTLDYYIFLPDGRIAVDDLKTGAMFNKEPDEIAQTYFYLMCLEKVYKTGKDGFVSITHWPKYPIAGLPIRSEGEIPIELLQQFEERLKRDYSIYKTNDLNQMMFRLGDECDFCPVKSAGLCPLQKVNI